jgi:glycosyltransferase involved in cell wall biosynthesis
MKQMQVLNLATSLNGGAGIAARRTHESLVEAGHDSHLLVLRSENFLENPRVKKVKSSQLSNFLSKANTVLQRKFIQDSNRLVTPISVGTLAGRDFEFYKPDVIHIHAYYNLLSTRQLWRISEHFSASRICVTLHDERLFTGGCHYTGGCSQFERQCNDCPQASQLGKLLVEKSHDLSLKEKRENYRIITPSAWLADQVRRSSVLKKNPVYTLINPVPQIFFDQHQKERNRSDFNIAFISQDLDNPYKGVKTVIEALAKLDLLIPPGKVIMNFVGRGEVQLETKNIVINTTSINSEIGMAEFLGKMNLVVLASTEDNLPNVILESLAAGARVIGTNIGGIKEVLDSFNLDVYQPGDSQSLSQLILKEFNSKFQKPNSSSTHKFHYSEVSKQLLDIYSI